MFFILAFEQSRVRCSQMDAPVIPPWGCVTSDIVPVVVRLLNRTGNVLAIVIKAARDSKKNEARIPDISKVTKLWRVETPHLEFTDSSVFLYRDFRLDYYVGIPRDVASSLLSPRGLRRSAYALSAPIRVNNFVILCAVKPDEKRALDLRVLECGHKGDEPAASLGVFDFLLRRNGVSAVRRLEMTYFLQAGWWKRPHARQARRWCMKDSAHHVLCMESDFAIECASGEQVEREFRDLADTTGHFFFESMAKHNGAILAPFTHPDLVLKGLNYLYSMCGKPFLPAFLAANPTGSLPVDGVFWRPYSIYLNTAFLEEVQNASYLPPNFIPLPEVVDVSAELDPPGRMLYYLAAPVHDRDVRVTGDDYGLDLRKADCPQQMIALTYEGSPVSSAMFQVDELSLPLFVKSPESLRNTKVWEISARYENGTKQVHFVDMNRHRNVLDIDVFWEKIIKLEFIGGKRLGMPLEAAGFIVLCKRSLIPKVFVLVRSEADYHAERTRKLAACTKKLYFHGAWAHEALARFTAGA